MDFSQGMPIPEGLGFAMEAGSGMPALPGFGQYQSWAELTKAVTAGSYVTDPAAPFTGGRALQKQSLEGTLQAVLQSPNDFVLFNKLNKTQAGAIVDEFTVVDDTGMWPGSAVNSELGDINESTGHYQRHVLQIKYLMDRRRVSVVQDTVPNKIASATATEQMLSTLGLLTSCEWLCFEGDSAIIPEEFDGIGKIVRSLYPGNIIDARGSSIDTHAAEIVHAAEQISKAGVYGRASHVFWSTAIQADVDQNLAPAVRVSEPGVANGGLMLGTPVTGIRSTFAYGRGIVPEYDKFIQEGGLPFALRYPNITMPANAPAAPTFQVQPAADAGTDAPLWQAIDCGGGQYIYAVEALNLFGRSPLVVSTAVTPTQGKAVTMTIRSANETGDKAARGYALYRAPKDGAADIGGVTNGNFREFRRIAVSAVGANTDTVFLDKNEDLPGSSKAYVLNLTPGMGALDIRRLAPMTRFNLYPTAKLEIPWAQFMFLALRSMKPMQHQIVKNLIPRGQTWRPR